MQFPSICADRAKLLSVIEIASRHKPMDAGAIRRALMAPAWPGSNRGTVYDIIKRGERVCFVVSDQTRRTAVDLVLPEVLRGLGDKGCRTEDMFILVASGIHRPPTDGELVRILGEDVVREFGGRIYIHDPDSDADLIHVGTTKRGHMVRVNRRAIETDRLVPIGSAAYHYHAGFSGGRKSLVPGIASRDTIAHNHSLTLDPNYDQIHPGVEIGRLDGNPVSEEMLEAAYLCRPDIIINTVLNASEELVGVFSGELDVAHRAACRMVEEVSRIDLEQSSDFVVAFAENASDWIQSHKALFSAQRAVKKGGRIVLVAPCPEGLGNERFRYWIRKAGSVDFFKELRGSSEVNGQTALSSRLRGANTILVTRMAPRDAEDLGIETAPDLDAAVAKTLSILAGNGIASPTWYCMPHATCTVPFCPKSS